MRIYFKNKKTFTKNAKRTLFALKNINIKNKEAHDNLSKIKLSNVQNLLAKSYGYSSCNELFKSLSDNFPQLSDLDNSDHIKLEKSIYLNFSKYLHENIGLKEDISHMIGFGIPYYLRSKTKKVKNNLEYDKTYLPYRNLSKTLAVTIPFIKNELSKNNLLTNTIPTVKAIQTGKVKPAIFESESYGIQIKLFWNSSYLIRSLLRKKLISTSPYRKYELPRNIHQAQDYLSFFANKLSNIISLDGKLSKEEKDKYKYISYDISSHPIAIWATWKDLSFRKYYLYEKYEILLEQAEKSNEISTLNVKMSLNKLFNWIALYKIKEI